MISLTTVYVWEFRNDALWDSGKPAPNGTVMAAQKLTYIFVCLFAGALCESNYVPCDPSPCHNGGQCYTTSPTTYSCSCVRGFEGKPMSAL